MMKKKKAERKVPAVDQILKDLNNYELDGLREIREIQELRKVLVKIEYDQIQSVHGEEHQDFERLSREIEKSENFINLLDTKREMAEIQVAEIKPDEALVHGRVVDEHLRGRKGLFVHLEDDQGKHVPEIKPVSTDSAGYYAFKFDAEMLSKGIIDDSSDLFFAVRDKAGKLFHREPVTLSLDKGKRVVREVVFADDAPTEGRKSGKVRKPSTAREVWLVQGTVSDQEGKPSPGLMVTAYDKDVKFDDILGAVLTDKKGKFQISYGVRDFQEGKESGPELYVKVMDAESKLLYSSEDEVRKDASPKEVYKIVLGSGTQKGEKLDDTIIRKSKKPTKSSDEEKPDPAKD